MKKRDRKTERLRNRETKRNPEHTIATWLSQKCHEFAVFTNKLRERNECSKIVLKLKSVIIFPPTSNERKCSSNNIQWLLLKPILFHFKDESLIFYMFSEFIVFWLLLKFGENILEKKRWKEKLLTFVIKDIRSENRKKSTEKISFFFFFSFSK